MSRRRRPDSLEDLWDLLLDFTREVISVAIACGFLVVWVVVHSIAHALTHQLQLAGVDKDTLATLETIVDAATLTVIISYLLSDLIVVVVRVARRTMNRLDQETRKTKRDESPRNLEETHHDTHGEAR